MKNLFVSIWILFLSYTCHGFWFYKSLETNNPLYVQIENRNEIVRSRLSRQIQKCGQNDQKALQLLYNAYPYLNDNKVGYIDGKCISSVIGILGRSEKPDLVTEVLQKTIHLYQKNKQIKSTKQDDIMILMCYRASIAAYGSFKNTQWWKVALDLLYTIPKETNLQPTVDLYHTAIAAMGKNNQIQKAFDILDQMEQNSNSDRMAYHAILTALFKNKDSSIIQKELFSILYTRMPNQNIIPNHMTYNLAIMACVKANECTMALQLLKDLMTLPHLINEKNIDENTYQAVISVCGRMGRWEDASNLSIESKTKNNNHQYLSSSHYLDYLNDFQQVGKGKTTWWELGRWYQDINNPNISKCQVPKCIRIGIQPHRNPIQNGITLLFYDADTNQKIGFILLRHKSHKVFTSALYGMYIPEQYRGLGMSHLFISIWLQMCLDMNPNKKQISVIPQTEKINKPLIALVLQNHFGFIPKTNGSGIDVQIIPLSNTTKENIPYQPKFALISPNHKSLEGVFSERDLRIQGMTIQKFNTETKKSPIFRVKTSLEHPSFTSFSFDTLEKQVKHCLQRKTDTNSIGGIRYCSDTNALKKAFFGFLDRSL